MAMGIITGVIVFMLVVVPIVEGIVTLYRLIIKGENSVPGDLSRDARQKKLDAERRFINTHLH